MTRSMIDAYPGMRQALQAIMCGCYVVNNMQDPSFLQQMSNPQTLQSILQLQQTLGG